MKIIRVILTMAFGWALLKCIELLWRRESADLLLFDAAGLKWLFYVLLSGLVVCQAASLAWFWKQFVRGYLFAFGAVVINLIETAVACTIAAGNTDVAKQAFIASRESRGLSVRPEMLQMMDNAALQFVPLAVSAPLAVVWCILIVLLIRANRGRTVAEP